MAGIKFANNYPYKTYGAISPVHTCPYCNQQVPKLYSFEVGYECGPGCKESLLLDKDGNTRRIHVLACKVVFEMRCANCCEIMEL